MRDDFGGHGLACARRSGEERTDAAAMGELAPKPPVTKDTAAMRNLVAEVSEPLSLVEGKHEVIPVEVWFDLDGQLS